VETVDRAIALDEMEKRGRDHAAQRPEAFDAYLRAVRPDDLATIIYTSGTTGEPKGVMLTHNNFMSNVLAIAAGLPIEPTDVALSVLPLSHIFERTGCHLRHPDGDRSRGIGTGQLRTRVGVDVRCR